MKPELADEIEKNKGIVNILLEDFKYAAAEYIPDEVIMDAQFEIVRDQCRRLTAMYVKGVYRAEILQETKRTVEMSVSYPKTWFQHLKQRLNEKYGWHLKVDMQTIDDSRTVTFKRIALYPHLPSLRKEYGAGKYVIKEFITEETR